jgi:uncharacterized metal-binding protein YceD (DUF177 family)
MPQQRQNPGEFRVSALSTRHPTRFDLQPDGPERAALARELELLGLKKLRFQGEITPAGARSWALHGTLGATVVQPCVVTLDPVTTRIEEVIDRLYVPEDKYIEIDEPGGETEMPEDTSIEVLGIVISAQEAMVESLLLALPQYPRATDADLGEAVFAEDGVTPLKDEDTKPFAGLAALKSKLSGDG